jgi:Na+/phosphate symporter
MHILVYNVLVALLVLPFTGLMAAAVDRLMPAKASFSKAGI